MELTLPRDARYVSLLRSVARCVLEDFGVPDDASSDVQIALTEACANAIRHAAESEHYSVSLQISENGCEVEVIDLGPGFEPPSAQAPPVAAHWESGRGLLLMRALLDDLQFIREQDGTRVRLLKRWDSAAPAEGFDGVAMHLSMRASP